MISRRTALGTFGAGALVSALGLAGGGVTGSYLSKSVPVSAGPISTGSLSIDKGAESLYSSPRGGGRFARSDSLFLDLTRGTSFWLTDIDIAGIGDNLVGRFDTSFSLAGNPEGVTGAMRFDYYQRFDHAQAYEQGVLGDGLVLSIPGTVRAGGTEVTVNQWGTMSGPFEADPAWPGEPLMAYDTTDYFTRMSNGEHRLTVALTIESALIERWGAANAGPQIYIPLDYSQVVTR